MVNVILAAPSVVRRIDANGAHEQRGSGIQPGPLMLVLLRDGEPIPGAEFALADVVRLQVDQTWSGPAAAVAGVPIEPLP